VETAGKKILVDSGLIQGSDDAQELNREPFPLPVADIDAVILTMVTWITQVDCHAWWMQDTRVRSMLMVQQGSWQTLYGVTRQG